MPGPCSEGAHARAQESLAPLMDAIREHWAVMDDDERAFLVYCVQRLRQQRDALEAQQKAERASG